MFSVADAYERMMGRWSRRLAPLFLEFVGVQDREVVLDVGCGTGSLTFTIARTTGAAKIVGIDPSAGFIDYARSRNTDPRVTFEVGDAQNLPYGNGSFDRSLALLIINFIPDAPRAAREMRRVTRPSGMAGAAMWDNGSGMELFQYFSNAAVALDPGAKRFHERNRPYGSGEALSALWVAGGLTNVEVRDLTIPLEFATFDDLWLPYTQGQGPGGAYVTGLREEHREALREKLRQDILGGRPDGPFTLRAKAWAVRGTVPDG